MDRDSSDILGQKTMPVAPGSSSAGSSFSVTKLVFWGVVLLVGYAIGLRLWKRILQWRERSYKLATRRRHGIPDSDLRPFNVAYTEAIMKAREEETRKQSKPKPTFRPQVSATSLDQREALPDQSLRQRSAATTSHRTDAGMRGTTVSVPGGYSSMPPPNRGASELHANGRGSMNSYTSVQPSSLPLPSGSKPLSRQKGYTVFEDPLSDVEAKKRSWNEDQDEEHEVKKSRVEGDELIDGDEDAEFEDTMPKRGSKRGIRDEEDNDDMKERRKVRGKRARKVSQEKGSHDYQADQSMDIDEEEEADEITELKSTSRGKKRDRAEAASTFGGDDDDSAAELEAEGDSKARRRRRKRRTVAKRKSEATYLRDKKRQRDGEAGASDEDSEESSPSKISVRRKRGKRSSHVDRRERERSKSDVSMDESTTSNRTKVREIGDEWESNGIKYKIGLNGQRLRQALVKKARQKFVMPKDSQHPDRDLNLQVCIECWLTEEEYQDAKADHMLAWQDSPQREEEHSEKLSLDTSQQGVQFPQVAPGKNLLWSTSTSSTPTISPASHSPSEYALEPTSKHRSYRDTYRHSIATSVGLPISPFASSTMPTVKRIASTSRALSLTSSTNHAPGLSDSTNNSPRHPHKVFSKWEKQELEAKAMMKVREANRKKEMERENKLKEEKEANERVERERAAVAERARAEKERIDRERAQKERADKERAEAERKAKEAASAPAPAVPRITVTAPSLGSIPPATSAAGSAPNNFFGKSPSGTGQPTPTPTSFDSKALSQTFFGAPADRISPSTTAPVQKPTGFSFNPAPVAQQKEVTAAGNPLLSRMGPQASEPPKPVTQPAPSMFSFSKPETSPAAAAPTSAFPAAGSSTNNASTTSSTPAASGATTAPKFSFGFGKTSAPAPSATSSSSLSGALGSTTEAKPPTFASPNNFAFKTPTTAASGAPATNGASAGATTAPKFSFNSSAFGGAKEPAKSSFGTTGTAFGGAGSSGPTTATTTSPFGNGASGGSKPAFGNGTTTSAFGNTSGTTSGFGNAGSSSAGNTSSAFGKPAAPSAFGGSNSTSTFGSSSTPSAFGGGGTSAFGAPSSSSNPFGTASGSSTTNGAAKSTFSFGSTPATTTPAATPTTTTTPSGTPAGGSNGFSFKFNGAPAPTTPQASPFGAAPSSSATSAFGNGAAAPSSVFGGGGAFGAPPTNQQK